ncbi:MAG: methylmalonyl-CoA epimerase [Candidatus Cloacimonetes bacterium]|nr:methylmalonyl-CoA epimerase [Candidatus Cloacimonadota bacterium]
MISKVSHIGIAVKNLEEAIDIWTKLGLTVEGIETVESQKVRVAFLPIGKEVRIELLEPTSEDSPIAKYIEKKGVGIHHLALASDDVINEMQKAENNGLQLIDKTPRPGAHNASIAFLHPKAMAGVLLELCQEKHDH